jgi:iron complex transport system ATP-binding protein
VTFETEDLVVRYPRSQRAALDGVTMRVPQGTLYAVLGPNGSGKSSLMRALLGVVLPAGGEARVEGTRVCEWTRRALAREIGAVAQSEQLSFPMSVREFVAMGRYPHLGALRPMKEDDHRAIEESLSRCDILDLAGRNILTLSGGELQRVRIARALAQEPRALILDEPTASLDVRHEMSIFGLLRDAVDQGMTVVLITHHLNLAARFADRHLLLDRGRVAAEGADEEVFSEEVLGRVYRWPVAVRTDPLARAPQVTPLDGGGADDHP